MRRHLIYFLFFLSFFITLPALGKVWAITPAVYLATFSLTPSTQSLNIGEVLTVKLNIDTAGKEVTIAEAVFNFNTAVLEFNNVTPGTFFPIVRYNRAAGLIRVVGTINRTDSPKTSSGAELLARLIFTAKTGGVSSLAFVCTTDPGVICCRPDEVPCEASRNCINSNILAPHLTIPSNIVNYINCTTLSNGAYTVLGPTGGPTPAPPGSFPPGEPTCDLCGACKDKEGEVTKPPNWQACRNCLYNADGSPRESYSFTPIGCVPTQAGGFVHLLLRFIWRLAGGVSFLLLLYGGFLILTSRGEYDRLLTGKRLVVGSIGALLLILFAVFLLRFIGVDLLGLPGFGR